MTITVGSLLDEIEEVATPFKTENEPVSDFSVVAIKPKTPNSVGEWVFREIVRSINSAQWKGYRMEVTFSGRQVAHEAGFIAIILAPKIQLIETTSAQARNSRNPIPQENEAGGIPRLGTNSEENPNE